MPKLIKDRALADNIWGVLPATDAPEEAAVPETPTVVPLNVWQAQHTALSSRLDTVGVWLDSHQLAEELGEAALQLPLVAVNFPTFMDGRGFSTARLLRERYGFAGELRTLGPIMRDQLLFLERCGFNSFEFDDAADIEKALVSFNDFSEFYQAANDQKLPLFRRKV